MGYGAILFRPGTPQNRSFPSILCCPAPARRTTDPSRNDPTDSPRVAPRAVCGLALAHVNTNAIEAAYRRTDLFERRRALMEQWSAFLRSRPRISIPPFRTDGPGFPDPEADSVVGRGPGMVPILGRWLTC